MTNPEPQPDAVARFWNDTHQNAAGGDHDNYMHHPLVQGYISLRAFGSLISHMDAAIHAVRDHTSPGDNILSLGCGAAGKERILARALPDRNFIGLDIADEVIAAQNAALPDEGIHNLRLDRGDFNQLDLEPDSLQLLLGLGAIHHVENLEGMWAQARRALKPGGLVMAQEYVGPSRFQWTAAQIEQGSAALRDLVPPAHQVHHSEVRRLPEQFWIDIDPSEAVRSAEILPTCRAAGFTIRSVTSAGGALLQPCLMNQIHTFDPQNWEHNLVLSRLFAREAELMAQGVLQDDFVMLVATPPA